MEYQTYSYPKVSGGYRWNMLQRCLNEVGIEPIGSTDTDEGTQLQFNRVLTKDEKKALDELMADNPTFPPSFSGSVFVIKDVLNHKNQISSAMGFQYQIYYSESNEGSGDVDQIELHFNENLTKEQQQKVIEEYGKLIALK